MQFPSYVTLKPASLEYLEWAKERLGGDEMMVEFRHRSWHCEDIFALLQAHRAAYCVVSGANLPCTLRATGAPPPTTSAAASRRRGPIRSERRSMGNVRALWQERPPISVASLQSSSERGVQAATADPLGW